MGDAVENDIDGIKVAVEQQIAAERNEFETAKSPSNGRCFTDTQVINYIRNEEFGIGEAVKRILRTNFLFETQSGRWYMRDRHLWKLCKKDEQFNGIALLRSEFELCRDALFTEASELRKSGDTKAAENSQARAEFVDKRGISSLRRLNTVKKVLEFSRCGSSSLAFDGEQFDLDPWLLAVENGVIDLRTGRLSETPVKDYMRKFCPVKWQGVDAPALCLISI